MATLRTDPYPNMNFTVQIGSAAAASATAGILEVIFPEARIFTYEYRNGNEPLNSARSLQTATRFGNITLKRGVIGSLDWYQWWQAISSGTVDRRTVVITLLDEARNPVMAWAFDQARPVNYTFSNLNALGGEALVETLELAFDSMKME